MKFFKKKYRILIKKIKIYFILIKKAINSIYASIKDVMNWYFIYYIILMIAQNIYRIYTIIKIIVKKDWENILISLIFFILFTDIFLVWYYVLSENLPSLVEQSKFHDVVIEDAKGFIDVNYIKGMGKDRTIATLKSYPVEFYITYSHRTGYSVLHRLILSKFKSCQIIVQPELVRMWSHSYKSASGGDFTMGETIEGLFIDKEFHKRIKFTFNVFIQHADGFMLDKEHKSWPMLGRVIKNKIVPGEFILKLRIDPKTIKTRDAIISDKITDSKAVINYYNTFHKWKPSVIFVYEGLHNKKLWQIVQIDMSKQHYYMDIFYVGKNNIDYDKIGMDYFKNFYNNNLMYERFKYTMKWFKTYKRFFFFKKFVNK